MDDLASRIVALLLRVDPDGREVHEASAVRHALPWLALALELPLDALGEGVQALIAEAVAGAGAQDATDPLAALAAYYEAHPVDPAIVADVQRALEGDVVLTGGAAKRAAALVGTAKSAGVLEGPRPAGTIPAALARLTKKP